MKGNLCNKANVIICQWSQAIKVEGNENNTQKMKSNYRQKVVVSYKSMRKLVKSWSNCFEMFRKIKL